MSVFGENSMKKMFHSFEHSRSDNEGNDKKQVNEAYLPPSSSYGGGTKMMKLSKFKSEVAKLRGQYISIGADGEIVTWNADLEREQTLNLGSEEVFDIAKAREEKDSNSSPSIG